MSIYDFPGHDGWTPDLETEIQIGPANPCPECGAFGTCGYDDEGRPYVHCVEATR